MHTSGSTFVITLRGPLFASWGWAPRTAEFFNVRAEWSRSTIVHIDHTLRTDRPCYHVTQAEQVQYRDGEAREVADT